MRYPQKIRLANASKDEFFGGLMSFDPLEKDGLARVVKECAARNIRVAGGADHMRIATHIFTTPTEINAFCDAMDAGLR